MFDFIQKHKRISQVILALLTIPFAIWGIESFAPRGGSAGEIASVNGLKISQRQFDEQLQRQQEQLRRMFGSNFDPAVLDTPETRRVILESMISQRVVASAALKADLTVTDDMLLEVIQSVPQFQEDGKFSKAQYELALRAQNPPMSPAQFEAQLRHDLALQQLERAVSESAIASRTVAARLASLQAQKREVATARIPAEQFLSKVELDDAQLKAYYDAHQAEFRTPERVKVKYVMLSADALGRQEPATEAEIKAAYEARASQYKVPEQRRASHILVKSREEAEKLLAELKKSPGRFAELAKEHSQDPGSARKGGDLGWFGPGMMVKPFEDAVFAMKKQGEIVGPVQSEFGFHIIRLTGVQPPKVRPLSEVRKELADELSRQKGTKKFAESAETFSNMVYEQPDSLEPAAERFKLPVRTSGWITRSAGQELGPLDNPKLLAALFSADSLQEKRNTDAVEVAPNTLVAAHVVEHQAAAQRSFADVKQEIADKLRHEKAVALAQKDGAARLERLRKGEDTGLKWSAPRTVSRQDAQGLPSNQLAAAVAADVSKLPAYVGLADPQAGYVLLRISKVIEADVKDQLEEAQARTGQLFGAAQYKAYVDSLRATADIDIKAEPAEKNP